MSIPQTSTSAYGVLGAVVAGGTSATLFLYALTHMDTMFGFFVVYLTPLPLFVAGLAAGSIGALLAPLVGAIGLFLSSPSNVGFLYTFIIALPAIILATLALRYRVGADQHLYWYPESFLLTAIAIYPCLIFIALVLLCSTHPGGLLAISGEAFSRVAAVLQKQALPATSMAVHRVLPFVIKSAPSLFGWAWMMIMVVSLYCAQIFLKKQKWNIRENGPLLQLHTPLWLIYIFFPACLMGVFGANPFDYVGINIGTILGFPFFCVGLAIVHAWAATTRFETAVLISFYVVFSVVLWLGVLITLLGAVDQWVDFRRRWCQPKAVHFV